MEQAIQSYQYFVSDMDITTYLTVISVHFVGTYENSIFEDSIRSCLLSGSFFNEVKGACEHPLDEEPCEPGAWLMVTQKPGVVSCQPIPASVPDCEVVLGPGGQVICLEDENLFGPCSEDGDFFYIPENFQNGTMVCPSNFHCQAVNDNNIYNDTRDQVKDHREIDYLTSLVCRMEPRSVCEPDDNSESLLSLTNVATSLFSPRIVCKRNPCPLGLWPSLGGNGLFICESSLDNRSVVARNKANCKRNQVFLYGRCRPRKFRHKKKSKKKKLKN